MRFLILILFVLTSCASSICPRWCAERNLKRVLAEVEANRKIEKLEEPVKRIRNISQLHEVTTKLIEALKRRTNEMREGCDKSPRCRQLRAKEQADMDRFGDEY